MFTVHVKIVYTDYQHAFVYQCGHMTSSGTCTPGQLDVDILSRRQGDLTSELINIISLVAPIVCLSKNHFEKTFHDGNIFFLLIINIM